MGTAKWEPAGGGGLEWGKAKWERAKWERAEAKWELAGLGAAYS